MLYDSLERWEERRAGGARGRGDIHIYVIMKDLYCCTTKTNTALEAIQFRSVTQSCPIFWDPMDRSTSGLPAHHQLPEFSQLVSIEPGMPSNHLILCRPLLLLPSIFPSIRVFSNESALRISIFPSVWPKYWRFSFNISPSNEHPVLISIRMDWLDLLAVQGTLKSLLQHHSSKHQFFCTQLSSPSNSHIHMWLLDKP